MLGPETWLAGYDAHPLEAGQGATWRQTAAPAGLPVSLAELAQHVRIDDPADEPLLAVYLAAAVRVAESQRLRRQLLTATWRYRINAFPEGESIELPRPPLRSVESVHYLDTAGVLQELDTGIFQVDTDAEPGRMIRVYGKCWPQTRPQLGAVTIVYQAGYGATAAAVPQDFRLGILHLAAHWYRCREPVAELSMHRIPLTVDALFGDRVHWM